MINTNGYIPAPLTPYMESTTTALSDKFIESINVLVEAAAKCEEAHGFREGEYNFAEKLALTHGELSEALEYFRKGNGPSDHIPEFSGVEEEFADVFIRLFSISQYYKLRLGPAIIAKMLFNESRPYRHGGKKF
jgi:NTP pyrophosphatase (non-canonical NTP hydrolase)